MVQNAETAENTASAKVLIERIRGHPSECREVPHPSVNGGEGFTCYASTSLPVLKLVLPRSHWEKCPAMKRLLHRARYSTSDWM
jgi:hypothetical protein